MIRRPPRSPLFPYPPLSRSPPSRVAQRPPLHPAHREGVGERPEHPVPHPVLRPAEAARPVAHRHLADPPPLHLDQRRRSEERRVGKSVDLGGRRIIKKKKKERVRSTIATRAKA